MSGLACAFLLSCAQPRVQRILDGVESALNDFPDSALTVLTAMDPAQYASPGLSARHALLYSLALDKNYIDVSDDSLARIAVDYYDRRGDDRHRMLAWYSLGRVQSNAQNRTGAVISFIEAEKSAERTGDLHYLGLIERNIGALYNSCYDWISAAEYYERSARFFLANKEKNYAVYSQHALSRMYGAVEKDASRDSLLSLLESYARAHDIYLFSMLLRDKAMYAMRPGEDNPVEALACCRQVGMLSDEPFSPDEWGTQALAFCLLSQKDSARRYLDLAADALSSDQDSARYFFNHYRIAKHEGDNRCAIDCLEKAVAMQEKILHSDENTLIANSLSDYYRLCDQRRSEQVRNRNIQLALTGALALLALVLLYLSYVIHKRRMKEKDRVIKEKEEKIQEDMARTDEIMMELHKGRSDLSGMGEQVNRLIREKMRILQLWADAYYGVQIEEKSIPNDPYRYLDVDFGKNKEKQMENFIRALETLRTDEELFAQLEESVNRWKENLMEVFYQECASSESGFSFKEKDKWIILLTFAELPDRTIGFLLEMKAGNVRTRRARLRERITKMSLPSSERFLKELGSK